MKYLKITIVLLVVLLTVGGTIYYFTLPKPTVKIDPSPSEIKQQTIKKDIHEKIECAPNSRFCVSAYDEIMKKINLFFDKEPSNRNTFTLMLQGTYTRKFVEQANYVFDRHTWRPSDIKTIRAELKRCKVFSPDDEGLKSINTILNEYDKLVKFNSNVSTACRQQPKCVTNTNYLYIKDDWDIATTNDLINSVPQFSSKVKNAPIYQQTRKNEVEKRFKNAHKQFIETKMNYAEQEAIGYNYNPARRKDYDTMGQKLYYNFDTYVSKWGESSTTCYGWQLRVRDWEKYTFPQTMDDNIVY